MEETGMTDLQWKASLRQQIEDWEDVRDKLESGNVDEALKKIDKVMTRISKSLE